MLYKPLRHFREKRVGHFGFGAEIFFSATISIIFGICPDNINAIGNGFLGFLSL
jgi:hypothetical protein